MENTLLIGLSRQIALQRELDVVANNVANMNTTGYKADGAIFEEYLMPQAQAAGFQGADRRVSYVQDRATWRDFGAGPIRPTGNPLDVAIYGDAFFVVQTPRGERYTRNGAFQINAQGELVTSAGGPWFKREASAAANLGREPDLHPGDRAHARGWWRLAPHVRRPLAALSDDLPPESREPALRAAPAPVLRAGPSARGLRRDVRRVAGAALAVAPPLRGLARAQEARVRGRADARAARHHAAGAHAPHGGGAVDRVADPARALRK